MLDCRGDLNRLPPVNKFSINFFDNGHMFITLNVHLCVPRDGRDAARRAAPFASAETQRVMHRSSVRPSVLCLYVCPI